MNSTNRFGVLVNLALIGVLLLGIASRTSFQDISSISDGLVLGVLAGWAAIPYGVMAVAHWRLRASSSAVLLVGTILIAAFGAYFLLDAFWLNFSPLAAGLPLAFMPLYQLPICVVTILTAKYWRRRAET